MQARTYRMYRLSTKRSLIPCMASNRERQMNARATATQAGYIHHLVAAVSLSPMHRG